MLKSKLSIFIGLFLLALPAAHRPAAAAGLVPEVSACRVISVATAGQEEKPPVISCLAIDQAGKLLAVGGDDHQVRVLNAATGEVKRCLKNHIDWVKASAFRPDGAILATAGADQQIRLWDMTATGRPVHLTEPLHTINTLVFSPDGRMLAAAGFGEDVWLVSSEDGHALRQWAAPGTDIRALCFSPDGNRLAAAGRAGRVRIWDLQSGRPIADVQASGRRICALAYAPDGNILAAAGQQRTVLLLNGTTGAPVGELPEQRGQIFTLCFCGPDLLASAGSSNVIHLWNMADRQERCRLIGHTGSVTTMVFDKQARTLLSGGYDTTVRVWDLSRLGQERMTRR